jgi:hypothetical protein
MDTDKRNASSGFFLSVFFRVHPWLLFLLAGSRLDFAWVGFRFEFAAGLGNRVLDARSLSR